MASFLSYLEYFLVGYAALTLAFYMLSFVVPKAAFVARSLASYICLVWAACFGVVASIVLSPTGYRLVAAWATARFFKLVMTATTNITFDVDDPKQHMKSRPAVFLANHQTELDVLMLGSTFPKYCSMTGKASLRRTPFLGWFMSLSGAIFLDRANSQSARSTMNAAANEIRSNRQSVYIFPEGTRSYSKDPVLLPFKKGGFHLAVQAQVPIIPIVVANYSHILWIRGLLFKSGRIPVKVLDPISTTGLTAADVDELTRTTRELMLKELIALTEKAQGRKFAVSVASTAANGVAKASGIDIKVAA
ncbi:hypothetical protein B0T26DRAFT_750416 [Lasiosphaeria miniovina]|uniref:1-acyl-sn-glycerol-3-phosphate acyltransferase n=1 Tax=Lasiosphaeria miniovina TaxID=1954250 RepID=A0AA40AW46_9PEZI|nr:uncharacterized protein B0T26DRAFT_750416 [Lasiosphaeria miniovina]KAK0723105.1 hypothetical protein B0T26DRAFT_750416 [Lasiosphaeria miniovina]